MRISALISLLIAGVLAVTGVWLTSPLSTAPCAFEVEISSSTNGEVQVYYDVGQGLSEAQSVSAPIGTSPQRKVLRLPLPLGVYRSLRFDPINHEGTVTFAHALVLGAGGVLIREISPSEFSPNEEVTSVEIHEGVATMRTKPGLEDPTLTLEFAPPLVLKFKLTQRLLAVWPRLFSSTLGLWFAFILVKVAWRNRVRLGDSPQTVVLLLSLGAAVLASYPVVFFGRSFVSPNAGSALLHSAVPTVPGVTDLATTNLRGSDAGAMMWQHLPYSTVQHRALLDGEWPLWNRYNSAGVTLLGQGQSMAGDPLHLLVVAAGGASWAWDVKYVLAKALLAAGLGLCVWRMTRDLAAAAIVAISAPFIGFYSYRFNHPAFFSVSYSPWILYAWLWLTSAANRREFAGGMILFALVNLTVLGSGTVKEAYLLAATLNALGFLGWCFTPIATGETRFGRGAWLAVTVICTALLTAPLWITFFDALRSAHTAYETPAAFQIDRRLLIGFFDDLFYNELTPQHYVYVPTGNAILLLGVCAALTQFSALRRTPWALVCLLGGLAAIFVAFEFMPASWILALPFLRNVHFLNNVFSAIALIPLWVVAGWGIHALRNRLAEPAGWRPLAAIAGMVGLALAAYFFDFVPRWVTAPGAHEGAGSVLRHAFFFVNIILSLIAGVALVGLAVRRVRSPSSRETTSRGLAAVLLSVLFYRHSLQLPVGASSDNYVTTPTVRADLAAPSAAVQFILRDAREPTRVLGLENELFPGFESTYGLEGINGPDAIMNPYYRQLAETAEITEGADWRFPFKASWLAPQRRLLDLLGVGYVVGLETSLPVESGGVKAEDLDLQVYRRPSAWPRAFFTDRLASYDTPAAFVAALASNDGRPFAAVQTGSSDGPKLSPDLSGRAVVAAQNYRLTANSTRFTVDAPSAGVVVLAETYLEGDFRVTVDGVRVNYFRVNHAFKGVQLPTAGKHEIAFTYRPRGFTRSLIMALFGMIGLMGMFFSLRRSK